MPYRNGCTYSHKCMADNVRLQSLVDVVKFSGQMAIISNHMTEALAKYRIFKKSSWDLVRQTLILNDPAFLDFFHWMRTFAMLTD